MEIDILTPNAAASQITQLLLPYIGMVMIVIIGFMIKDYATKLSKGIAFSMNNQFKEGDKVILDGERALIVKIGLTQTVFGIEKDSGQFRGDYVWRYVPNEKISNLKLEKVVLDHAPINNKSKIRDNTEKIEELINN